MQNLGEALSNPVWWLTVVLAGIIVNLVAAYLKPKLDASFSRTWGWWRDLSETRKARYEAFVSSLRDSPVERYKVQIECAREVTVAVFIFLMGIFIMLAVLLIDAIAGRSQSAFLVVRIGGFIFGTLCWMLSFVVVQDTIRQRIALFSAIDTLPEGERP